MSDNINRIKVVYTLLFQSTSAFKMFVSENYKIFRQASPRPQQVQIPQKTEKLKFFEATQKCPNCGTEYKLYGKFEKNPDIDKSEIKKGLLAIPKTLKIHCSCGFEIDLTGLRNDIESKTGRRIVL